MSDLCYEAGTGVEARQTPGECELHFKLAYVYGAEHARELYNAVVEHDEALGHPGDWPREVGEMLEFPHDDADVMPDVPEC